MIFILLIICLVLPASAAALSKALQQRTEIFIDHENPALLSETADVLLNAIPQSRIVDKRPQNAAGLVIGIVHADSIGMDAPPPPWVYLYTPQDGPGQLLSTNAALLYSAVQYLKGAWPSPNDMDSSSGHFFRPSFSWVEGLDGFFAARKYWSRGYVPEENVREMARIGCTHLPVNALATPFPYEQGPPGEHYYRFYLTNPDLDQFVATDLNKHIYPPEYLDANINQMHKNIKLAEKYGLYPGLNLCSPRSVPESFFKKYPFLRGARIDHPFHSYEPRYTMTLAHPVVRWHYAEMMREMLSLFPQLDYAYIWSNDSGAGFEHTMTTYPGRNGGAFLVREWLSNEEIAEKAGKNIVRYLELLRDAGRTVNKDFRVILRLFSFPAAKQTIIDRLGKGLDMRLFAPAASDSALAGHYRHAQDRGSRISMPVSIAIPYSHVAGVAFPWTARQRLEHMLEQGVKNISMNMHPFSLAPHDINREIFHVFQFAPQVPVDSVVARYAQRWAGSRHAPAVVRAWYIADSTVRHFPSVPLYQGYGFVSFRLWVRPLVPDIARIPEKQRAYYEDFMLSNFYNPALVDLSKNALWTLVPVETAREIIESCDRMGWKPLLDAIDILSAEIDAAESASPHGRFLIDQRDRLQALVCYYRTLENTARWIVGVHGYLDAGSDGKRQHHRRMLRTMMQDEIENSRNLKSLLLSSETPFTPISAVGENWYTYGENLSQLVQKKIDLMQRHMDDEPFIDADFMWKMPAGFQVPANDYLQH